MVKFTFFLWRFSPNLYISTIPCIRPRLNTPSRFLQKSPNLRPFAWPIAHPPSLALVMLIVSEAKMGQEELQLHNKHFQNSGWKVTPTFCHISILSARDPQSQTLTIHSYCFVFYPPPAHNQFGLMIMKQCWGSHCESSTKEFPLGNHSDKQAWTDAAVDTTTIRHHTS